MEENTRFIQRAHAVLANVRENLADLATSLGDDFIEVCQKLTSLEGRVVTVGIGKSSFIAQKMAATLASLGQPAGFLHPSDAGHGDLGNVTDKDMVVVFSHSGASKEILQIMPSLKRRAAWTLAICGNVHNALASLSDYCLATGAAKEGCSMGLAPTTSTTSALVLADCLACAMAEARGFTQNDFAYTHPSGRLGQLTTQTVADVMLPYDRCPVVYADGSVMDSIISMAEKSCAIAIVIDSRTNAYLGLQSSAMVKQALAVDRHLTGVKNAAYLITNVPTVEKDVSLQEAYQVVGQQQDYDCVPVLDDQGRVCGLWYPQG